MKFRSPLISAGFAILSIGAAAARAEVSTLRLAAEQGRGITIEKLPAGGAVILLDLEPLQGKQVLRARLLCERDPVDGTSPDALVDVEIFPILEPFSGTGTPVTSARALELAGPWYRAFDATETVRAWAEGRDEHHALHVKAFPRWRPERTRLDVDLAGAAGAGPPQPTGLRVHHRVGQTFITWTEFARAFDEERVSWGKLRKAMAEIAKPDSTLEVRYRVFRSSVPIARDTLAAAELLAEVEPLSSYNVEGRSLEALIYLHRRRSAEDIGFARELGSGDAVADSRGLVTVEGLVVSMEPGRLRLCSEKSP